MVLGKAANLQIRRHWDYIFNIQGIANYMCDIYSGASCHPMTVIQSCLNHPSMIIVGAKRILEEIRLKDQLVLMVDMKLYARNCKKRKSRVCVRFGRNLLRGRAATKRRRKCTPRRTEK